MPIKDSKLRYGPTHTNLNMICALDIRVGGLDPLTSDLLEVCIMPLNHSYRPHQEFPPFNICIRPSFLVDLKIASLNKDRFQEQFVESINDVVKVEELLNYWWGNIRVKPDKRIIPLVWDWPEKKKWLQHWLGETYSEIFHESYRDALPLLNFINDREDYRGEEPPYKFPTFDQLIVRSGMTLLQRNSLMANCKALSDCYRYLLHQR